MKRANPRIRTITPEPPGSETDAQNPPASVADAVSADPALLQKELAAQKDDYLRLAADFDNFQKRTRHEAVSVRYDPGRPDRIILEVTQRGYCHGDTVFRPAKVVVNDLSHSPGVRHGR